jgi:hypothetical protein
MVSPSHLHIVISMVSTSDFSINEYTTIITIKLLDFVHRPDFYKQNIQQVLLCTYQLKVLNSQLFRRDL